jgi:peptide/nickel transport system substrate-binding protein
MTRRRRALALASALTLVGGGALVAGCGGSDSKSSDTGGGGGTSTTTGTVTKGGTYRMAMVDLGYSNGFDPSAEYTSVSWNIQRQLLLRPLLSYRFTAGTAGNEPVPDLATEIPTPTNGGKTWTFTLKDGVKFGSPLNRAITSKDVAYAFERMANPKVAAGYSFYYSGIIAGWKPFSEGKAKTISGITTPDAKTIVFTLTKATGDFAYRMTMPATAPIPPEVGKCFETSGAYGRYVISSGPYEIEGADKLDTTSCKTMKPISGFNPVRSLQLIRNKQYDPATDVETTRESNPDAFSLTVNTNSKDIFDKIAAGELEDSQDAIPADVTRKFLRDDALKDRVKPFSDDGTRYITMNLTEAPFDDVHVRKAVNFVMDKEGLQRAWGGSTYGVIPGHMIPPSLLPDTDEVANYDPYPSDGGAGDVAAAMEEMKLSAYDKNKDGLCDAGPCKGVLMISRNVDPYPKMEPVLVDSLKKIGITPTVRSLPTGSAYTLIQTANKRVPIAANPAWSKDYSDASTFSVIFDGRNLAPTNNSNYSLVGITPAKAKELGLPYPKTGVPSLDADIDKCGALPVGEERLACWFAFDKKLMEEVVPVVPYLFSNNTDLLGPAVSKWDFDQSSSEAALAHVAVDVTKQKK